MNTIIDVKNLDFGYGDGEILKGLSFAVKPQDFLAIAGPNGAGKTTLLNLLCGLLKPKAGAVKINGKKVSKYSPKELAQKISVVRQEFVPVFDYSVQETVAMARTAYRGLFGFENSQDRQIINEALDATDTAEFASRPLRNLSGGERQRVFIARALAQNTAVLLLDEPTSFLDLKHQVQIYDLLKKMQVEKGKTLVIVTHDINLASQYADRVLLIGTGSNYHIGHAEEVFTSEKIEEVFGVRTFARQLGSKKFFIALGKFAKDKNIIAANDQEAERN
jgi:iron complex transport system ATP-binding protein